MEINESPLSLQTDQQTKRKNPVEIHNYPKKSIIQYSEPRWNYTYEIIEEGYYPPATYLKYTKGQSFQIPDNYKVKSSWGKPKKRQSVRCIIKYEERNPVYWVYFGEAFQYHIKSEKSSSDAANLYVKVHTYNDLLLIVKFLNFINAKSNFLK